jgi:hypothetical protein
VEGVARQLVVVDFDGAKNRVHNVPNAQRHPVFGNSRKRAEAAHGGAASVHRRDPPHDARKGDVAAAPYDLKGGG